MDDLAKILLTAAATAFAGMIVFVASQLLGKLVIEPIQDFKKLLGEIRYALVFHEQAALTPGGKTEKEDEAATAFRKLACDLRSKISAVPLYDRWARMSEGFLPKRQDVIDASVCLMGLSNTVHSANRFESNPARISKIERLLGFEAWDGK